MCNDAVLFSGPCPSIKPDTTWFIKVCAHYVHPYITHSCQHLERILSEIDIGRLHMRDSWGLHRQGHWMHAQRGTLEACADRDTGGLHRQGHRRPTQTGTLEACTERDTGEMGRLGPAHTHTLEAYADRDTECLHRQGHWRLAHTGTLEACTDRETGVLHL